MKQQAAAQATEFRNSGKAISEIAFCMLTDEPAGQPSAYTAQDEAYHEAFRVWLNKLGKSPARKSNSACVANGRSPGSRRSTKEPSNSKRSEAESSSSHCRWTPATRTNQAGELGFEAKLLALG